jgi:hypothetical protein
MNTGMTIGTWTNTAKVPQCPPKVPQNFILGRSRASAVRGRRLLPQLWHGPYSVFLALHGTVVTVCTICLNIRRMYVGLL